ncbi:hypothetical protein HDU80_011214 [Chytriomyces hyalinus]|nr:hypothetical protein HDU80_011214 [Chytriomyces hyalinus]
MNREYKKTLLPFSALTPQNSRSTMQFVLALIAFAVSVLAQSSDPAAPSNAPSAPSTTNSLVLISPNGNLAYKSGDPITITWNIGADDATWKDTDVMFEIADASQGANKVTPITQLSSGVTTKIGSLQFQSTVPDKVPAGGAYCVRAGVRGTNGFVYFFSPNFPINQDLKAAVPTTSAAAAAAGTATITAAAPASAKGAVSTSAPASAKISHAEKLAVCFAGAFAVFAF